MYVALVTASVFFMVRALIIKIAAGPDQAERANQGLTVAAAGTAMGAAVSLWLTGEAVWFAVSGRQPDLGLEHAQPAADLLEQVAASGTVTVCSQCATRRDLTEGDLVDGARIAGAAAFVAESLAPDAQALVY